MLKKENSFSIFTELNTIPEEFKTLKLSSKGFFLEATVQDFPILGKNVFYILSGNVGLIIMLQVHL